MSKTVEKVYAGALLEAAQEGESIQPIRESLLGVRQVLKQNPMLLRFFCVPVIEKREKLDLADSLFAGVLSPYALNFLKVLIDAGRFASFFSILEEFERLCDLAGGIERAVVRTAYPVKEEYRKKLQEKMEKMTGKRVSLEYRLDSSLIGGIVIDIGDRRIDNSIKSRLEQLENAVSRTVIQKKGEECHAAAPG